MSSEYSIYSPFDPDKHKDTYKNYLEVLLLEDGSVVYAIPSHQEKAMALACERLGVTRELICDMCPIQYYADFLNRLLSLTNSVSVWNNMISCWSIYKKQVATLRMLKSKALYKGPFPLLLSDPNYVK